MLLKGHLRIQFRIRSNWQLEGFIWWRRRHRRVRRSPSSWMGCELGLYSLLGCPVGNPLSALPAAPGTTSYQRPEFQTNRSKVCEVSEMIWHPKPGQHVRIHYRKEHRYLPCQGRTGIVLGASKGPGPRNVCVGVYDEHGYKRITIIPRGNLNHDNRYGYQSSL